MAEIEKIKWSQTHLIVKHRQKRQDSKITKKQKGVIEGVNIDLSKYK